MARQLLLWLIVLVHAVFCHSGSEKTFSAPLEVKVALDLSAGTSRDEFDLQRESLNEIIRRSHPESEFSLIEYGATQEQNLDSENFSNLSEMTEAVVAMGYRNLGSRDTAALVRKVEKDFQPPDERKTQILLLYVNGPSESPMATLDAARALKVKTVAITTSDNFPELGVVATDINHTFRMDAQKEQGMVDGVMALLLNDSRLRCNIDEYYHSHLGCRQCLEVCKTPNEQCRDDCPYYNITKELPITVPVVRDAKVLVIAAIGSVIGLVVVIIIAVVKRCRGKTTHQPVNYIDAVMDDLSVRANSVPSLNVSMDNLSVGASSVAPSLPASMGNLSMATDSDATSVDHQLVDEILNAPISNGSSTSSADGDDVTESMLPRDDAMGIGCTVPVFEPQEDAQVIAHMERC